MDSSDTIVRLHKLIAEPWVHPKAGQFVQYRLDSLCKLQNDDGSFGREGVALTNTIWAFYALAASGKGSETTKARAEHFLSSVTRSHKGLQQLITIDWAVLCTVISDIYKLKLSPLEVEECRRFHNLATSPSAFMRQLPKRTSQEARQCLAYAVSKGRPQSLGVVPSVNERVQLWHDRIPTWVWGFLSIVGIILALVFAR